VSSLVQFVAVAVSGILLLLVIDLVRRRKLTEEYSFIWLLCALALLVLSLWRGVLDVGARWLGVFYPPAALLLVLVFFMFVALLYFSVVISGQRRQIEHLVEELAILDARLRQVEQSSKAGSGPAAGPYDSPAARPGVGANPHELGTPREPSRQT
jgi:hypothetical protein